MPRATAATRIIHRRLDADARSADQFVDLQFAFRGSGGETIARYGGRWDRARKTFVGPADRSRVIVAHGFQADGLRSFDAWFARHLAGTDPAAEARARELVLADAEVDAGDIETDEFWFVGGRRSGKTFIGFSIGCAYAVSIPDAIVWIVVPTENAFDEPLREIDKIMPHDWFTWHGDPGFRFDLVNGSRIYLRSAVKPGNLKRGRADLVVFNECQQIKEASFMTASASTIDRGGATIIAANPPIAGDEQWVLEACQKLVKHEREGAEIFLSNATQNPHVNQRKVFSQRAKMDDHTWATQMKGELLELPDAIFYGWSRAVNERKPPQLPRPITHDFLTAHEGDRADWKHLVVIDVQMFPWIAAGVFEVYRDPGDPDPKAGILWMVDEVALAQADEVDVADELKRRGIDGARTLVVMDASCRWQQARRDTTTQRPQYTGKGSMDIMRANGFKHVVPPSREISGNMDVVERIRTTNAAIRTADGISHFYIDPAKCPNAIDSVRKWRLNKRRKPSRDSKRAHFGDVISYCVVRFKPRRTRADDALQSEGLKRARGEGFGDLEE